MCRHKRPVREDKTRIKGRVTIDERAKEVNKRETFGHYEAVLIVGANNKGRILVLKERKNGFIFSDYLGLPQKLRSGVLSLPKYALIL